MKSKPKGSVFRDSTGRWRGVVDLPKSPGEPRKQKTFRGNPQKSDAQQQKELWSKINALLLEIENGTYLEESNATLKDYLKNWHEIYAAKLAQTTQELYKLYTEKHIIPELGKIKIKEIRPMHIQEFYNKKSETLSDNTLGKIHTFLNKVLNDAYKDSLIKTNPCSRVDKPRVKRYKPTLPTEQQFFKLLEIVRGTFDEVCILLAGICGLRRGEVFGLRLRDVDFKESKISIVETMVRFNGKWIIKAPKNETSQRTIRVPRFVVEVINTYLTNLKVIPERICGKYKPDSYSKHFKKLCEDNGIPDVRYHDLRHFNATLMLKYGIPDKIASSRLGHSQVQTTKEIYQHMTQDMDIMAAEIIEGVFTKDGESKAREK